jgi:predicted metal-binding membrane protein
MGEMPMAGGWTMSMAWTRMPGQTWPGAASSFLGMWVVMMVAMMLPSLAPMLRRYRQAVRRTVETRLGLLTALVGAGYFFVWAVFAMAVFPLDVALAAVEMRVPALSLGLHCTNCSVGLMAILLVIWVMDLRAMAVVAAAITVERLAPVGEPVARATGAVAIGAGLFLIVRAAGLA